ncbi:haloacid dehalogenase hydrolase domain-containing protein [Trifolium repens]|nr:haloacid dehalogenase hydrolase domain-containing protein [Trifolium repens]
MVILCLAETKSSVILCLENLIGIEHFQSLDCFLAGDDVKEKKPDPSIYLAALKVLNRCHTDSYRCLYQRHDNGHCTPLSLRRVLVSTNRTGKTCMITYTSSTADQARTLQRTGG